MDSSDNLLARFLCTATSCVVADAVCLLSDLVKARLQLQNELLPASAPRLGVIAMARPKQALDEDDDAAHETVDI